MKRRPGLGTGNWGLGSRNPRDGMIATVLLIALLPACSPKTAPRTAEPFPQTGEVAGWARSGTTRTFPAADLWEYIDGDAERYIQAGVEKTLTIDYRFRDKTDAVVDIHVMKSIDGTKRLMAAEGAVDSRPASVGEDARLYPASLVFRKGHYLVRVVAFEESPGIGQALVELGQAIEKKL